MPVVDVRSENEYAAGHVASAINIPLLNNSERVIVGTAYKQHGQKEAIREGFRLVGPRLLDIVDHARSVGDELIVHCWRGGMRSGNFCQFVNIAGLKTHQLGGGYKAYRQYSSQFLATPFRFIVLAGLTGSGKTEMLQGLRAMGEQVVDLEGLANHKGSVFGGLGQGIQPTTEQFQNDLFEELYRLDRSKRIWIEDESIAVGKVFIPQPVWKTMLASPVACVNVEKEVRLTRLVKEYGSADKEGFAQALKGITRKLGGQNYNAALNCLSSDDFAGAIDVILNYYDKAYHNAIERKKDRIRMEMNWRGNEIEGLLKNLVQEANKIEFEVCQ